MSSYCEPEIGTAYPVKDGFIDLDDIEGWNRENPNNPACPHGCVSAGCQACEAEDEAEDEDEDAAIDRKSRAMFAAAKALPWEQWDQWCRDVHAEEIPGYVPTAEERREIWLHLRSAGERGYDE